MGTQLAQTQIDLLKILACSIKNQKYDSDEIVDYSALYNESMAQTVFLQTISALDLDKISDIDIRKNFSIAALRQMGHNLKIHAQHGYVHKVLHDNNIDYCILKGSASAYFYPRPLLRMMGDVDFLVRKSDVQRVENLFKQDGFVPLKEHHICHIVLQKEKIHLEMHFAPAGMPDGKNGELICGYLADIFDKAELVQVEGATFRRPSLFHHGLILLMHMYHHLLAEGIGLRHVCDWALWINSVDEKFIEQEFREKLLKCGLWEFARILSCLSFRYLDIPFRNWMGEINDKLLDDLMLDIFHGGNFGCLNSEREKQGWAISSRGKNGIAKNNFSQLFHTANSITENKFPILFMIPILRYCGTLLLISRYFFKVMAGKRENINLQRLLSDAKKRKYLYKKFHLFETEN